ncbi:cysteine-rich receptor-like protein kinase 8 [Tanacetum coccineum]
MWGGVHAFTVTNDFSKSYKTRIKTINREVHHVFLAYLTIKSLKKQIVISRSSTEAEYKALADCTCEITWLQCFFKDFQLDISGPTPIYCDNAFAIALASNPIQHARTKHIEIDCHFVRDKIKSNHVLPTFIPTRLQAADVLTKGIPKALHYNCLSKFGICDPFTLLTCRGEGGNRTQEAANLSKFGICDPFTLPTCWG